MRSPLLHRRSANRLPDPLRKLFTGISAETLAETQTGLRKEDRAVCHRGLKKVKRRGVEAAARETERTNQMVPASYLISDEVQALPKRRPRSGDLFTLLPDEARAERDGEAVSIADSKVRQ